MIDTKIPIFEVELEDEVGIFAVSLVKNPAMAKNWMAFSEDEPVTFAVQDEEQRKVLSVLLRADYPIIRKDKDGNLFYLLFKAEVIEKLVRRMLANNAQNTIDLDHNFDYSVEGVEMSEIYIKNTQMGINPKGFEDVADGSAFCVYRIESDELWEAVKQGRFNGVSIEAFINYKKPEMTIDDLLSQKS